MLPKISGFHSRTALLSVSAAAALVAFSGVAQADIIISSDATQNVSCLGGTCAPTAASAVLNAGDLQTMLASGNVVVTTTGSGVQADNIVISAALSWSNSSALALDAYQSVSIDRGVAVQGSGGLTLMTDDGGTNGTLAFGHQGSVTFASLSSSLTINGTPYTLVNTIQSLAGAVAANPSGAYAFASGYDASLDGTYATVPVPTTFTGTFEGLGNAISNLSIDDPTDTLVGLFAEVATSGTLRDVAVLHANVSISASDACAAPLVGQLYGVVIDSYASGSVSNSGESCAGGLVGHEVEGTIVLSSASTNVSATEVGGLVGNTVGGTIEQSFATGKAVGTQEAGGLIADDEATVSDCYATGTARVPKSRQTWVGGLAAQAYESDITYSYSTGHVDGGSEYPGTRGGFIGASNSGTYFDNYWDLDKSGFRNTHKGVGNAKNLRGVTGLTTKQFQSGLPAGFDPSVWGETKKINGGLPYLLANPPR